MKLILRDSGELAGKDSDASLTISLSRAQALDVINYAHRLQSKSQVEKIVDAELKRFNLADDIIAPEVLVELAQVCGVEKYVEEARRVIAPTVMEQYDDIFRFGGKVSLDQYRNFYHRSLFNFVQQTYQLDEGTFNASYGHVRITGSGYTQVHDGTCYFSMIHKRLTPVRTWWGFRSKEKKEEIKDHLGGVNYFPSCSRLDVRLYSDSPQFTARVLPFVLSLNDNFGTLLTRGGYDPLEVFSFCFEAHYLPT